MLIERMRDRGSGIDSGGIRAADAVQGYTAVHVMRMSNRGVVCRSEIFDGTEEHLLAPVIERIMRWVHGIHHRVEDSK